MASGAVMTYQLAPVWPELPDEIRDEVVWENVIGLTPRQGFTADFFGDTDG